VFFAHQADLAFSAVKMSPLTGLGNLLVFYYKDAAPPALENLPWTVHKPNMSSPVRGDISVEKREKS
jgi:hypothetical protein